MIRNISRGKQKNFRNFYMGGFFYFLSLLFCDKSTFNINLNTIHKFTVTVKQGTWKRKQVRGKCIFNKNNCQFLGYVKKKY